MEPFHPSQQRIGHFYTDMVLPALAERLDRAFARTMVARATR